MESGRWTQERAHSWMDARPWLLGCNFTPSNAGNQLEMWQEDTFDPVTIDRELGWAAGLGMNVVRVYLHHLLHDEGGRFLRRMDDFLATAASHGIGVVPVLLDGVWHPRPRLGPQPAPKPRLHNSVWVQSPGAEVLYDRSRWGELRPYVSAVVGRFADDPRIVAWDLFNEPDQADVDTLRSGSREEKSVHATDLARDVFSWARDLAPSQPLTVGVWEYDSGGRAVDNRMNEMALSQSDIVSFHCYEPREQLEAVIGHLETHGRPLLCTEWLARTNGSTVDLLDVFVGHRVGAINWGLVDGRTQTRYPWKSWQEPMTDDEPWFHELLHRDGSPYDEAEAAIFRTAGGAAD